MVAPPRPDPLDRYVVVDGSGLLVSSVARLLRAEGVRWVEAAPWAADAADAELRRVDGDPPDLVVLVRPRLVDPRLGEPWRRRRVAHLPVTTSDRRVVVGPWLTGDPSQPCLGCLAPHAAENGPEAGALLTTAAGMTAMVALAGLAGQALPAGVSVEVHGPWPRIEHRRWSRDLDCPLHEGPRPSLRQAASTSVF